ncbi:MAG: MFS transporter [Micromonosporaceae bacterium]
MVPAGGVPIRSWRNAVFVVFALNGVALASWTSRTPTVRDGLHASTTQMGLIIFGLAAGSVVGLTASSHLIARIGGRTAIRISLLGAAAGLAVVGLAVTASSQLLTVGGLLLFGLGYGLCDVAMNLEGAAMERVRERTLLPIFHAVFSLGTLIGAGVGTLAETVDTPLLAHLTLVAVVIAVSALALARYIPAHSDRQHPHDDRGQAPVTARERFAVWHERRTLLLGVVVLGLAFAEGSANDWLALAMVDGHHVANNIGALALGVFVAAMTIGRVAGVKVVDAVGRVPVLRVSAALAVAGLAVMIYIPSVWLAMAGVALWGLGAALGFPVGLSAAADEPRLAAARVSAVSIMGYIAFLAGPPALGLLGDRIGLLYSLNAVIVLVVVSGFAAGAARPIDRARNR